MAAKRLENDLKKILNREIDSYLVEANLDNVQDMSITIRMETQNKLIAKIDIKIPEDYPFQPPDLSTMEIELFKRSYEPILNSKSKGKEQIYRRVCDAEVLTKAECLEYIQLFSYITKFVEENLAYIDTLKKDQKELDRRVRLLESERNSIGDSTRSDWQRLDEEIFSIYRRQRELVTMIDDFKRQSYLGYGPTVPLYVIIENIIIPIANFYSRLFASGRGGTLNDALAKSTRKMLKL